MYVAENYPDAIKIDKHDSAIIGYDTETGRLIYSCNKIIHQLSKSMSISEAKDYVEYNILRAIPGDMRPIVMETG